MFTPLVGVPMENSLDLVIVWAMYGSYTCRTFWPMPMMHPPQATDAVELLPIRWPKRLTQVPCLRQVGNARLGSPGARATFEQGCLSVLPHLEGPCKALSLPGEHLFQASRVLPNRMRPVIFHAFGKAKHDAPKVLNDLAQLGWETLPIALLGMPRCAASWVVDTWRPIGGCCYTGSPVALAGDSAFRFCLLMQWRTIDIDPSHTLVGSSEPSDPELVPVESPGETNEELLVRQLLHAGADQNSQESRSQAADRSHISLPDPQKSPPCLFVPWKTVAHLVGIPEVQAEPLPNLRNGVLHAIGFLPEPRQSGPRLGRQWCP